MTPKPQAFIDWPRNFPISWGPEDGFSCVVDRVWDGDTFFVWAAIGPPEQREYIYVAIRIADLKKPESWQKDGPKWREKLKKILPRDTPIKCYVVGSSFGRWAAHVTLADGRDLRSLMDPEEEGGM